MKKIIVCLVTIFAILLSGGLVTVHALPLTQFIEVEGFADPTKGTMIDNGTTTTFSGVTYTFNVTSDSASVPNSGAEMDFLSLEFDPFAIAGFGAVTFSNPADWDYYVLGNYQKGSVYLHNPIGTTLGVGKQLMFTVKDVEVYNSALAPGGVWQEGQRWAQSWNVGDTLGGNDGGSTALVPEPGTLLLFGSGLAGLFYVRRKKVFV